MNVESAGKISFARVTEPTLNKLALVGQLFLYISIPTFNKIQQMVSGIVTDRHTTTRRMEGRGLHTGVLISP